MAYTRTDSAVAALGTLTELVPVAVITRGGDGAIAVDQTTGEYAEVPALNVDVLDATGAGDVFGASFVAASLGGWPLEERLRFAVLAAGLSVQHHGGGAGGARLVRRRPLAAYGPRSGTAACIRLSRRQDPGGPRPARHVRTCHSPARE